MIQARSGAVASRAPDGAPTTTSSHESVSSAERGGIHAMKPGEAGREDSAVGHADNDLARGARATSSSSPSGSHSSGLDAAGSAATDAELDLDLPRSLPRGSPPPFFAHVRQRSMSASGVAEALRGAPAFRTEAPPCVAVSAQLGDGSYDDVTLTNTISIGEEDPDALVSQSLPVHIESAVLSPNDASHFVHNGGVSGVRRVGNQPAASDSVLHNSDDEADGLDDDDEAVGPPVLTAVSETALRLREDAVHVGIMDPSAGGSSSSGAGPATADDIVSLASTLSHLSAATGATPTAVTVREARRRRLRAAVTSGAAAAHQRSCADMDVPAGTPPQSGGPRSALAAGARGRLRRGNPGSLYGSASMLSMGPVAVGGGTSARDMRNVFVRSSYAALFLSDAARTSLLEAYPPVFSDVRAHHAAVAPITTLRDAHALPLGRVCAMVVAGYACTPDAQVVLVDIDADLPPPPWQRYFVTVSVRQGVDAPSAGAIAAAGAADGAAVPASGPVTLAGCLGAFVAPLVDVVFDRIDERLGDALPLTTARGLARHAMLPSAAEAVGEAFALHAGAGAGRAGADGDDHVGMRDDSSTSDDGLCLGYGGDTQVERLALRIENSSGELLCAHVAASPTDRVAALELLASAALGASPRVVRIGVRAGVATRALSSQATLAAAQIPHATTLVADVLPEEAPSVRVARDRWRRAHGPHAARKGGDEQSAAAAQPSDRMMEQGSERDGSDDAASTSTSASTVASVPSVSDLDLRVRRRGGHAAFGKLRAFGASLLRRRSSSGGDAEHDAAGDAHAPFGLGSGRIEIHCMFGTLIPFTQIISAARGITARTLLQLLSRMTGLPAAALRVAVRNDQDAAAPLAQPQPDEPLCPLSEHVDAVAVLVRVRRLVVPSFISSETGAGGDGERDASRVPDGCVAVYLDTARTAALSPTMASGATVGDVIDRVSFLTGVRAAWLHAVAPAVSYPTAPPTDRAVLHGGAAVRALARATHISSLPHPAIRLAYGPAAAIDAVIQRKKIGRSARRELERRQRAAAASGERGALRSTRAAEGLAGAGPLDASLGGPAAPPGATAGAARRHSSSSAPVLGHTALAAAASNSRARARSSVRELADRRRRQREHGVGSLRRAFSRVVGGSASDGAGAGLRAVLRAPARLVHGLRYTALARRSGLVYVRISFRGTRGAVPLVLHIEAERSTTIAHVRAAIAERTGLPRDWIFFNTPETLRHPRTELHGFFVDFASASPQDRMLCAPIDALVSGIASQRARGPFVARPPSSDSANAQGAPPAAAAVGTSSPAAAAAASEDASLGGEPQGGSADASTSRGDARAPAPATSGAAAAQSSGDRGARPGDAVRGDAAPPLSPRAAGVGARAAPAPGFPHSWAELLPRRAGARQRRGPVWAIRGDRALDELGFGDSGRLIAFVFPQAPVAHRLDAPHNVRRGSLVVVRGGAPASESWRQALDIAGVRVPPRSPAPQSFFALQRERARKAAVRPPLTWAVCSGMDAAELAATWNLIGGCMERTLCDPRAIRAARTIQGWWRFRINRFVTAGLPAACPACGSARTFVVCSEYFCLECPWRRDPLGRGAAGAAADSDDELDLARARDAARRRSLRARQFARAARAASERLETAVEGDGAKPAGGAAGAAAASAEGAPPPSLPRSFGALSDLGLRPRRSRVARAAETPARSLPAPKRAGAALRRAARSAIFLSRLRRRAKVAHKEGAGAASDAPVLCVRGAGDEARAFALSLSLPRSSRVHDVLVIVAETTGLPWAWLELTSSPSDAAPAHPRDAPAGGGVLGASAWVRVRPVADAGAEDAAAARSDPRDPRRFAAAWTIQCAWRAHRTAALESLRPSACEECGADVFVCAGAFFCTACEWSISASDARAARDHAARRRAAFADERSGSVPLAELREYRTASDAGSSEFSRGDSGLERSFGDGSELDAIDEAPQRQSSGDARDASLVPDGHTPSVASAHGGDVHLAERAASGNERSDSTMRASFASFGAPSPGSPLAAVGELSPAASRKLRGRLRRGRSLYAGDVGFVRTQCIRVGIGQSARRYGRHQPREPSVRDFVEGNERTVLSARGYGSFEFKDYSPFVFRMIRRAFGISSQLYAESIAGGRALSELASPGKSGQAFYFSYDGRFVMKAISKAEARDMRAMLMQYYRHISSHPNTLIMRILGLHRFRPKTVDIGQREMHLVVMANVFDTEKVIHERYDLKGSVVGRAATEKEKAKVDVILKEADFQRSIVVGSERRLRLLQQIYADVKFLESLNIMDYSMLIGIHFTRLRTSFIDPESHLQSTSTGTGASTSSGSSRTVTKQSFAKNSFDRSMSHRIHHRSEFMQQDGGMLSSPDEDDDPGDVPEMYFLGIIDIFQKYNRRKKMETIIKSIRHKKEEISAVDPHMYAERFYRYMEQHIE